MVGTVLGEALSKVSGMGTKVREAFLNACVSDDFGSPLMVDVLRILREGEALVVVVDTSNDHKIRTIVLDDATSTSYAWTVNTLLLGFGDSVYGTDVTDWTVRDFTALSVGTLSLYILEKGEELSPLKPLTAGLTLTSDNITRYVVDAEALHDKFVVLRDGEDDFWTNSLDDDGWHCVDAPSAPRADSLSCLVDGTWGLDALEVILVLDR